MASLYIEMCKRNHLCTRCRQQDAYTLVGRSKCAQCAEYEREHRKKYYAKNRDKIANSVKSKRLECEDKNICIVCQRRPIDSKFKSCHICRSLKNARARAKAKYRQWDVICRSCGKLLDGQLKLDGTPSKLCSSCYTRVATLGAEIFKKYWKSRKESKNGN